MKTKRKQSRKRCGISQDTPGIACLPFKVRTLLSDADIAALYAGQRYENYRGRERLDNVRPQKVGVRSNITCTALVTSQGGGVI